MSKRVTGALLATVVLVGTAVVTGCSTSTAQSATPATPAEQTGAASEQAAEQEGDRLPQILEGLELSAEQLEQLRALRDDLEERLEPATEASGDLALAIAQAAKRCDGNHMAIEDAVSWANGVGQQVRGDVLDGVDRLHHILTRKQRRTLARRLINSQEQRKKEDRTEKGAQSLDEVLDLSLGQMLNVMVRGAALQSLLEERLAPWRVKLERALAAFPDDDFAIRDHEVVEAPIVAIATRFMRDAVRTLMPILEPEQCAALDQFIREELKRQEQRQEQRREERKKRKKRT